MKSKNIFKIFIVAFLISNVFVNIKVYQSSSLQAYLLYDFNNDLGISNTEFGLAIGIQMLGWGLSGPIFGAIADKYGGHRAIILAFLFYLIQDPLHDFYHVNK